MVGFLVDDGFFVSVVEIAQVRGGWRKAVLRWIWIRVKVRVKVKIVCLLT